MPYQCSTPPGEKCGLEAYVYHHMPVKLVLYRASPGKMITTEHLVKRKSSSALQILTRLSDLTRVLHEGGPSNGISWLPDLWPSARRF